MSLKLFINELEKIRLSLLVYFKYIRFTTHALKIYNIY